MRLNRTWTKRVSASRGAASSAGRYAVLGLAAIAGLHVVWQVAFGQPVDVVGPARTIVNKSAVVGSFAQDYVSTWLTATSADAGALRQFVSVDAADLQLPSTPAVVISAPTVVAVTYEGDAAEDAAAEVYSVVVAVNERPYDSAPPTRGLYRVPVLWSAYGPRAAALPARVQGPGSGADVPPAYPMTLAPRDTAFQVVSGFVTAYLTDAGGVDRFATADSGIVGLGGVYRNPADATGRSAPMVTAVTATATPSSAPTDGETVRVLARVTAMTSQYAPVHMVYPLTLRGVGGHWSVAAIDRAPVLSDRDAPTPVVPTAPSPTTR